MKRVNRCIENKKEKYNANKIARIFLSSPLKLGVAIALNFIFFLIFSTFVLAEGWDASKPSHGTLYVDTITSKTDASPVNVADSLFVVEGITTLGNVGIGTSAPTEKLELTGGEIEISTVGLQGNNFADRGYDPERPQTGLQLNYGSDTGGLLLQSRNNPSLGNDWDTVFYWGNDGDDNLRFSYAGWDGAKEVLSEKMRITSTGNVGIGTTGPHASLELKGQTGQIFDVSGGSAGQVNWRIGGQVAVDKGFEITPSTVVNGFTFSNPALVIKNDGNVGIGTTTPIVSLDTTGDFKWQDVRNYKITRSFGSNANDWVEIGSFANTGISQYAEFTVQGHWCGSIISAQFRYDDIAYTGSSTNWLELPIINGGKVYNNAQPVAIDIKRANPGATSDPILVRIRNLINMCGGTGLFIYIQTNAAYTPTSASGTGGTVDAGYAANNAGWKFPVTTDSHAASTNGLYILSNGNVGIGTINPTSKLHVIGKGTFTGGVDPPYVSFSDESHESIKQYAKEVEDHEKVMQFWNGKAHRMEIYVLNENKFYTLDGELINEQAYGKN